MFGYDRPEALIDRVPVSELVTVEQRELVASNIRQRLEGALDEIRYIFRA